MTFPDEIQAVDFDLVELSYMEWPLSGGPRLHYTPAEAENLPALRKFDDERAGTLHPLRTVRQINQVAHSARVAADTGGYADTINRLTDAFVETAHEVDDALYFPYRFDFDLHGNDDERMMNPWFSGMAQGLALGTFARLYHVTGDDRHADLAERTYRSLTQIQPSTAATPWVATVDSDGYYWIEEYPINPPAHTLNGKLFAGFGLYEYWRVKGRSDIAETLRQALTTVLAHMAEFRRPGDISQYCLKHASVQSAKYHHIHIEQLHFFYQGTEDARFAEWASRLRADYWNPQ